MAKDNSSQEMLKKIQKHTEDFTQETIQQEIRGILRAIQDNENPLHQEIFSQTSSDLKKSKLNEIMIQAIKANDIINKAFTFFAIKDNEYVGLHLAQYYLELASVMDYIFKLIKNINTRKTVEEIQAGAIEEIFAFYLEKKRVVISQGMIIDSLKNEKNANIFKLEEKDGEVRVVISRVMKDYKLLITENSFDKSVNKHWENYKKFTKEHYFGPGMTGRRLYYLLGQYEGREVKRGEFWDWWHTVTSEKDFQGLIDYFLNISKNTDHGLGKDLEQFLRIAQKNDNQDILSGKGSGLSFGHVAESFERHLEECHHFGPTGYPDSIPEQLRSEEYPDAEEKDGFKGWVKHLARSTGAWPGTFGPDTQYAQVKQYATMVSGNDSGSYRLSITRSNFELAQSTLIDIILLLNETKKLFEMVGALEKKYRVDEESIAAVSKDLSKNQLVKKGF